MGPERDYVLAVQTIAAVPRILDVVCRTTGMGFAAVARVTEERWIACAVRDDIAFGLQPGGELRVETTLCHEVRQQDEMVVIDDVLCDATFARHPTPQMYGFRSYISVPIRRGDGRFFGTLCAIDPRPARLQTAEIIDMFTLFAELIALHLDASDRLVVLEQQVEQRTAALRQLNEQLERLREEERTRIARELHDQLGQTLSALKLGAEAARAAIDAPDADAGRTRAAVEFLARLVSDADDALDVVERIVTELRPAVLDALGLPAAVEWLVGDFARRTGIKVTCQCDESVAVSPEAATAFFRVLQEALTNVSRHAAASTVAVTLGAETNAAVLIVEDNGRGIPDAVLAESSSFGLLGMHERLRAVGGTVAIDGAPGGGTRVVARCALAGD